MTRIPELIPISELRIRQSSVLEQLKQGPVVLTQRSKAAAVLVDPDQWNRLMEQLEDLQDLITVLQKDQAIAAGKLEEEDVNIAELEAWRDEVPA